jgi:hypothetical protein
MSDRTAATPVAQNNDDTELEERNAQIDAIVTAAGQLSSKQVAAIHDFDGGGPKAFVEARRAARIARSAEGNPANAAHIVRRQLEEGGISSKGATAAQDAVMALTSQHLVSTGIGYLTQEHINTLMGPWAAAMGVAAAGGALWEEDKVLMATRTGYVGANGTLAVLGADVSPADGQEAARRMLGTDEVAFAGMRFGYPSYTSDSSQRWP